MANVEQVIDPLITLTGPPEFVALGAYALAQVTVPFDQLLAAPHVVRYVETMGNPAPSWAQGYYRSRPRYADVRCLRRPDGKPRAQLIQGLTIHELIGHGSDAGVLDGKRKRIMALMRPIPSSWDDDDNLSGMAAYWRLPSEAYANRMVEAATAGRIVSTFDDDYTRWITNADLPKLLAIVTEPPVIVDPPDVEPPVPSLPMPPSSDQLLIEALAKVEALEAGITKAAADLTALLDEPTT